MKSNNLIHSHVVLISAVIEREVPFSAMWSPSFVPAPRDWPKQCRVVGSFFSDKDASQLVDESDFRDFLDWLDSGDKPIFLGFGSMMIKDTTKLSQIIVDAARKTRVRLVVQSGWSKLDASDEQALCFGIGSVEHDWLLPKW